MKKILCLLFFISALFLTSLKTYAEPESQIDFQQGLYDKKPMMVLLYASWADDVQPVISKFNQIKNTQGNRYNYVMLDIASSQTKSYNKVFAIMPNLPYVMLFKNKAKITRYLDKSCILDDACFAQRAASFAN